MTDKTIHLTVDGMTCNNCAAGLTRFLEQKGLEEVYVNFATKEVHYEEGPRAVTYNKVVAGIEGMGYRVLEAETPEPWWTLERKLVFSAVFTLPLILHHLLMMAGVAGLDFLANPWLQLTLTLPVFAIGCWHFGKSAWSSLSHGIPNMDVLIFTGSTAAFIYSLIGLYLNQANYIFFETAASIITLVLLGNWLEKRSVKQTTSAIDQLTELKVEKARQVMPSGTIVTIDQEEVKPGFVLQVNEGDQVPADGRIISGEASLDESMLTGESIPVFRAVGGQVIGASTVSKGNFQMEVTATGHHSVLHQIIELVKTAQQEKPDIQRLADRISAIFVPAVLAISLLTLTLSYFVFHISFTQALLNSIAVLVISCPCAMGLATPTAVMVGVGRVARNGILIRGGQTLETFAGIKNFVFDKTGTLTTGEFKITNLEALAVSQHQLEKLILEIEQHSSHPIAHSLVAELKAKGVETQRQLTKVQELPGKGMEAWDADQNHYRLGSSEVAEELNPKKNYDLYLYRNDQLLGGLNIGDQLRSDASATIEFLQNHGLRPILLSGDRQAKTASVAAQLGITDFHAAQLPAQKLAKIAALSAETPTAMIGDGINDAPALAKATIGVSLSTASEAAIQSAQIVLLNGKLEGLVKAIGISNATLLTIKQNLFWAFAYNIVAIPIAAMGYLNPMWGALFMAFSDVVVIGNSLRLKYRRIYTDTGGAK